MDDDDPPPPYEEYYEPPDGVYYDPSGEIYYEEQDEVPYDAPEETLSEECLRHIQATVPDWREIFDRVAAAEAASAAWRRRRALQRQRREEEEPTRQILVAGQGEQGLPLRAGMQAPRSRTHSSPFGPTLVCVAEDSGGDDSDDEDRPYAEHVEDAGPGTAIEHLSAPSRRVEDTGFEAVIEQLCLPSTYDEDPDDDDDDDRPYAEHIEDAGSGTAIEHLSMPSIRVENAGLESAVEQQLRLPPDLSEDDHVAEEEDEDEKKEEEQDSDPDADGNCYGAERGDNDDDDDTPPATLTPRPSQHQQRQYSPPQPQPQSQQSPPTSGGTPGSGAPLDAAAGPDAGPPQPTPPWRRQHETGQLWWDGAGKRECVGGCVREDPASEPCAMVGCCPSQVPKPEEVKMKMRMRKAKRAKEGRNARVRPNPRSRKTRGMRKHGNCRAPGDRPELLAARPSGAFPLRGVQQPHPLPEDRSAESSSDLSQRSGIDAETGAGGPEHREAKELEREESHGHDPGGAADRERSAIGRERSAAPSPEFGALQPKFHSPPCQLPHRVRKVRFDLPEEEVREKEAETDEGRGKGTEAGASPVADPDLEMLEASDFQPEDHDDTALQSSFSSLQFQHQTTTTNTGAAGRGAVIPARRGGSCSGREKTMEGCGSPTKKRRLYA